jgi:hypothetical protein
MSIKSVVSSIRKLDTQTAVTMQQMVVGLVDACTVTFGGDDMSADQIKSVQDQCTADAPWKGTSSEGARRSEIKACLIAYPYYFGEACAKFRTGFGELRRNHVLMIARELPKHESWKEAVAAVIKKIKAKKVTTVVKDDVALKRALSAIAGIETRSQKIIKFRKALAVLAAEHGVS